MAEKTTGWRRKRKNKFDITIVFDKGGSIRLQSATDHELTRQDVKAELAWLITRIDKYEAERGKK